jgi:hypothetical protein
LFYPVEMINAGVAVARSLKNVMANLRAEINDY